MKKTVLVVLISCFFSTSADAQAPQWSVSCTGGKDQFGDKQRKYCKLYVSNATVGRSVMNDGQTFYFSGPVVEVDQRGLRLLKPPRRAPCASGPVRIAVDAKRVDALPAVQQLKAMTIGDSFIWEQQAEWPHCNMAPYGSQLAGFRDGLIEAQRRFNEIK
jgi:hypothetical protein